MSSMKLYLHVLKLDALLQTHQHMMEILKDCCKDLTPTNAWKLPKCESEFQKDLAISIAMVLVCLYCKHWADMHSFERVRQTCDNQSCNVWSFQHSLGLSWESHMHEGHACMWGQLSAWPYACPSSTHAMHWFDWQPTQVLMKPSPLLTGH